MYLDKTDCVYSTRSVLLSGYFKEFSTFARFYIFSNKRNELGEATNTIL